METSERNEAVRRKADDHTTINQETIEQRSIDQRTIDQRTIDQGAFEQGIIEREAMDHEIVGRDLNGQHAIEQVEVINKETIGCKAAEEATDCPVAASEEEQYLKRYRHCRRLIENDGRFIGMTDEEKDAYAQRLATPEYLDLTCDWAFKYLFQNHPELLVRLLNDILEEDIMSVEFRNTELTEMSSQDKRILFDLLCQTPGGTILVEMQKASRFDQRDRLLFYGSRLVTRQVKRGDEEYALAQKPRDSEQSDRRGLGNPFPMPLRGCHGVTGG